MLWKNRQAAAPTFIWDAGKLLKAEWTFVAEAGVNAGTVRRLSAADQSELAIDALGKDIAASMEIEGEFLDRSLVTDGIRNHLGLNLAQTVNPVAEGCAKLAMEMVRDLDAPLKREWIDHWGGFFQKQYRREPASAPGLSDERRRELGAFLHWFNAQPEENEAAPLVRAGLAHLWFESIHPLELGTGVLGRVLAHRVLAQGLPNRVFIPLGAVLLRRRNDYLRVLDEACRDHDATQWLLWFAAAAIEAGRLTRARTELSIRQGELLERLHDRISGRQRKIIDYFFQIGFDAFVPGVSPAQYAAHTGRETKSVAADMANLAAAGALVRSVRARSVRYHLALPAPEVAQVEIEDVL